ncbi:hypothetical protein D3C71_994800 [compost metagenome]
MLKLSFSSTERAMVPPTAGSTGVPVKSSLTASTTLAEPDRVSVTLASPHCALYGAGRQTR